MPGTRYIVVFVEIDDVEIEVADLGPDTWSKAYIVSGAVFGEQERFIIALDRAPVLLDWSFIAGIEPMQRYTRPQERTNRIQHALQRWCLGHDAAPESERDGVRQQVFAGKFSASHGLSFDFDFFR